MYEVYGVIGLLFITKGILLHDRTKQDIMFILGGVFLEIYSYLLGDVVFMTLQLIVTLAASYDLIRLHHVSLPIGWIHK